MGLLERALKYKKQLNETGRETLIDRIKGPAESEFSERSNSETIVSREIDDFNIQSLNEFSADDITYSQPFISESELKPEPGVIENNDLNF